mmetsp:Transcript_19608/g.61662  ORF Transcript_19608/g.61662 Transcript_19608/m.61662 type:complete len:321 (+) Transcript_19608:261-1223(+)
MSREASQKWDPRSIRENPDEAFDVFDINGDGVITISELCFVSRKLNDEVRKRGSLLAELEIFSALDLDGDAQITRAEFCHVVANRETFSDEALGWISRWCRSQQGERVADDEALEALAATASVAQGVRLARRNFAKEQSLLSPAGTPRDSFLNDLELDLELIAMAVKPVDLPWYDVVGLSDPVTTRAFAVLLAADQEVGRTAVIERDRRSSSVTWPSLYATTKKLTNLLADLPEFVKIAVYAARSSDAHLLLGATEPFALVQPQEHAPNQEIAIGPLLAYDDQGNLGAKIVGTQKWVPVGTSIVRDSLPWVDCSCLGALY